MGCKISGVHDLTLVMMVVWYFWCAVAKAATTLGTASGFEL